VARTVTTTRTVKVTTTVPDNAYEGMSDDEIMAYEQDFARENELLEEVANADTLEMLSTEVTFDGE
jgi:urease gamma subunit